VIDLSLNEAETLAAKAARGGGFSWGLADDIGRAARRLARQGENWSEALLALVSTEQTFEAPTVERISLWRRGERDAPGARPLCPIRTAALLLDAAVVDIGVALRLSKVGMPIWLAAMLTRSAGWTVEAKEPRGVCDATIRRCVMVECSSGARRAAIAPHIFAALNGYAARTYVPESERSRRRGAGGGGVDDE
jgi:hypothetical protein